MTVDDLLKFAAMVVAPSGAAWTAVKVALNGTRKRIDDARAEAKENHTALAQKVDGVIVQVGAVTSDLSYLKGRVASVLHATHSHPGEHEHT